MFLVNLHVFCVDSTRIRSQTRTELMDGRVIIFRSHGVSNSTLVGTSGMRIAVEKGGWRMS